MANVGRDDEHLRNEALLEVANLLEMARSLGNMNDPQERLVTLSTVIAVFEGMAIDEGGTDGAWNPEETESILDSLRSAAPDNVLEGIRALVQFLTEIVE